MAERDEREVVPGPGSEAFGASSPVGASRPSDSWEGYDQEVLMALLED